jgi:hypothetical protein
MPVTIQPRLVITGFGSPQVSGPNITANSILALGGSSGLAVAASQTNLLTPFAFKLTNAKFIYLDVDQALTLKTNNSGSPTDTLNLVVGSPIIWFPGGAIANPFTGDVSSLYLTNTTALNAFRFIVGIT